MNNRLRKYLALIIVFAMILSANVTAFAEPGDNGSQEEGMKSQNETPEAPEVPQISNFMFAPMALVNPGPVNYTIATNFSLLNAVGSSTNDHTQAVYGWYDSGDKFHLAVQSTHELGGTMKIGTVDSSDTHIYNSGVYININNAPYAPNTKVSGNVGDARWTVYVFNGGTIIAGDYKFSITGVGGGHDIKSADLTISARKIDITVSKVWVGGTTPRPDIQLQLYRDGIILTENFQILKDGTTSYTWNLDQTDNKGKNYIYTVQEVGVPTNYLKSEVGLTVTNTFGYTVTVNYIEVDGDGNFVSTISTSSQTIAYNSSYNISKVDPAGFTFVNSTGDLEEGTVDGNKTINYNYRRNRVNLTVTAKDATKPYDGTALTKNEYDLVGTLIGTDELVVTIVGTKTNAGTAVNEITEVKVMNGTTNVTGNYNIAKNNGTLTVTKAPVTITAASENFTYDGSPHTNGTYTVAGLVGTDNITATVLGTITYPTQSPVTNEVTGHSFAAGLADNYTVSYINGSLTMGVANIPVIVTANSDTKEYTGSLQTVTGYGTPVGLLAGHVLSGVTASGSGTNVGPYDVEFVGTPVIKDANGVDVTQNYAVSLAKGKLTITASNQMTVSAADVSKEYDGTSYGIVATSNIAGAQIKYWNQSTNAYDLNESPKIANVADSQLTVKFQATHPNYVTVTGEAKVTISKKAVTITAGSASKVYDGTALVKNEATATGLVLGHTMTATVAGSQTSVGTSDNVVTLVLIKSGTIDVTGNYAITYVKGTLTVTQVINPPYYPPYNPGGGGGSDPEEEEEIIDEEIPQALPELNKVDHIQYIQGYPDNTVRPEGLITREEVAAVFFRLLAEGYRESIRTFDHTFPDVSINRWSRKHIATLAKDGLIEGYEDGSFRPGNYITRAELATIASRFDNLSPVESNSFSDISGHWANKYINSASAKGWVDGYPDGTFKPDQYINRAEFVTLVNNVLDRRVKKENILPEAKQFPDLLDTKWYYEAMQESINSHRFDRMDDTYEEWIDIYYPKPEM